VPRLQIRSRQNAPPCFCKLSPVARYGTRRDIEEKYRISEREIYQLLNAGLIKAKKHGNRRLIDLQSVEDHLAALPDYEPKQAVAS
jgi:hypothetical protein